MIKINRNQWQSRLSPLNSITIEPGLLFCTDITDYSKKTESHSHNWIQFIYTRTGTVYVEVNEKLCHLPPFHGVWIPKNNKHVLWSSEKAEYVCVNINKDFGEITRGVDCRIVEISSMVDVYVDYFLSNSAGKIKELELKENAFLHFLSELDEVNFTLPYPSSKELVAICQEIQADPGAPHTPEDCARKLNISQSTFVRRFKKETGLNYQEWRQRMRLLQSISRVKGRERIINIAIDIGYSSASSYIYAFKKVFGVSPTKYISNK